MVRIPYDRACKSPLVASSTITLTRMSLTSRNVVDMEAIRSSGVKIGIDPLGGASVHFWQPIIERYRITATIVQRRESTRHFGS